VAGSIRLRLTLWYALALAAILAASGVFWYVYLERTMLAHQDERLEMIAEDVAALHRSQHKNNPVRGTVSAKHCSQLEEFLRQRNWGEQVLVRGLSLDPLCRSNNLRNEDLPLSDKVRRRAIGGASSVESVTGAGGESLRLVSRPIELRGEFAGLVQVAASLHDIDEALERLRLVLLTFSPLALLAMSFGGWFLAGRTLSPLAHMIDSMQLINARQLGQRLPLPPQKDEMARLAETFNEMLERLEDSFRRIQQFSGDASHEMRTPLTILKGETEVALRWAREPEEFRKVLGSNLEEINRMERIIEDLLDLAKSDAGELPLEISELSLSDLVQELYLQGRTLAEGADLEVSLDLRVDHEVRIRGDELRLRQMFLNLLSNAVKYTPAPGTVAISLANPGAEVVVSVRDSGVGIAEEHLAHIFDRFYRVDRARNRNAGGAGLGLSIARWVAEAHDGSIEVFSRLGGGSEFRVTLPVTGPKDPDRARPFPPRT